MKVGRCCLIALGWWVSGLMAKAEDDPAAVVYWVKPRDVISKDATEAQQERKQAARADLDLESSMREKGYFWVPVKVKRRKAESLFLGGA